MTDQLHILVIGLSTLDLRVKDFEMPAPDEHLYLPGYQFSAGGSAVNMAFSLAQLGAKVQLCTRLGPDFAGKFVRRFIESSGIDLVARDGRAPTGFSIINCGGDGRIALAHCEGANDEIAPEDIPLSQLVDNDVLHIAGAMSLRALDGQPMVELFEHARSLNKTISLHTSRNTDKKELLLKVLPYVDFLFLNEKEAIDVSGHQQISLAANWLRDRGVKTVAITLGPAGAFIANHEFSGRIETQSMTVVDSTGCGDAFAAGFMVAASKRMDVRQCAVWGNVLGGLCVQAPGPIPFAFSLAEVERLASLTTQQWSVPGETHHAD